MIKCRFFYMRIILLSFWLLFNYSNNVTSCPSSGDGDCVPSTDTYNKDSKKSTNQVRTILTNLGPDRAEPNPFQAVFSF